MRISSVRKGASGSTIVDAGGSSFIVDLDLVEELGLGAAALAPGAELGEAAAAALALAAEAREAQARGLALLARAEQSTQMLRAKLAARGFSEAAVRIAVGRLAAAGLADDRRFARAYAASRLARRAGKEGPATLSAALRGRGVDADAAASAISELLEPEARREALAKAASEALRRSGQDRDEARARLRELGFRGGEISEYFSELDESRD